MGGIIYGLCALTAGMCAYLLLKAYRTNGYSLTLWGGLCFSGLTLSNVLLIVDKLMLPIEQDLAPLRYTVTLIAMMILIYGLIFDTE